MVKRGEKYPKDVTRILDARSVLLLEQHWMEDDDVIIENVIIQVFLLVWIVVFYLFFSDQ